ncbi:MAG: type II toxin-antitoxin system RelE/ParE family toxin [Rhodospirillaceae bacterium]|nr:type II toxin-antitoxin system RelE/ParE family toxin [Rhodospirillaceae bacterium]
MNSADLPTESSANFSPAAERDLLEIVEWIANDNPIAAKGFVVAVEKAARSIGEHPQMGTSRPDIASPPVRFLAIRGFPHVVVYTPDRTPPLIIRILHGARDLPEVLGGI